MATVIDALVVTLGLNAKGFFTDASQVMGALKKTGDTSAQTARQMDAHGQQAAQFFGRVRNEALALLAVFTAGVGLKQFTTNTIQSASGLGLLASNLGMGTERLQAWQHAAERAGGSAQGMTAQLRQSAMEVAKYQRGMSAETLPAFFQYGGKLEDLKDGNSYLLARSRIVSELYKTDRARAALAAQMMGIADDQFDFIRQGPAAIAQMVAEQQKRSSITEKDANNALKLRNLYLDLRDTFASVGTKILVAMIPAFERLIKLAQKWGDDFLENRDEIVQFVEACVENIGAFVKIVDNAAQSVGGWKNVLIALASLKILSTVRSLTALASAIGAVARSLVSVGSTAAAAGVGVLSRVAGGVGMALYSKNLNEGETETLEMLRAATPPDPTMKENPKAFAQKYLHARGFDRAQISGILANLIAESNLDINAVGDGGKAYGIAQWHPDRQAKFQETMRKNIRESSLEDQLTFMVWELRNTEKRAMKSLEAAKTPAEAARAMVQYERPKDREGEGRKRARIAADIYAEMPPLIAKVQVPEQKPGDAKPLPIIAKAQVPEQKPGDAKPLPIIAKAQVPEQKLDDAKPLPIIAKVQVPEQKLDDAKPLPIIAKVQVPEQKPDDAKPLPIIAKVQVPEQKPDDAKPLPIIAKVQVPEQKLDDAKPLPIIAKVQVPEQKPDDAKRPKDREGEERKPAPHTAANIYAELPSLLANAHASRQTSDDTKRPRNHEVEERKPRTAAAIDGSTPSPAIGAQAKPIVGAQAAVQTAVQASPVVVQMNMNHIPASNTTNDHSSQVNIHGPVTVQTQASDAQQFAQDLGALGHAQNLLNQADSGVQ